MPYLLAPNIDGTASLGRLTDLGLSVNPADIFSSLDMGFMGYVEGYNTSGWGFNLDYSFMDLSDSGTFAGGAGTASADIFQSILSADVFRRIVEDTDTKIDVYGGLRWWDIDLDVNATLGGTNGIVSMGDSWVEPHVGLRLQKQLPNSDWSFNLSGDIGGFGVSSDFAWNLVTGFTWHASDRLAVEVGYRALGVDFESGTAGTPTHFVYDTITHGPRVGLVFAF